MYSLAMIDCQYAEEAPSVTEHFSNYTGSMLLTYSQAWRDDVPEIEVG